jgi:lipid-binding SYLF domain-containing protein
MRASWRKVCMLAMALIFLHAAPAAAASKEEIDAKVAEALENFYKHTRAGKRLAAKAAGMLVFPDVVKVGFGLGGEYGEGALLVKGRPVAYYSTAAASVGFQLGAQVKSQILLFMNQKVLEEFRRSDGWQVGVDGGVALVNVGAGAEINTDTVRDPIVGFVFSTRGLMYNLTLEGSKFSRIQR